MAMVKHYLRMQNLKWEYIIEQRHSNGDSNMVFYVILALLIANNRQIGLLVPKAYRPGSVMKF